MWLSLPLYTADFVTVCSYRAAQVDMMLKRGKTRDVFRGSLIYPNRFGSQSKILLIAEVRGSCLAVVISQIAFVYIIECC